MNRDKLEGLFQRIKNDKKLSLMMLFAVVGIILIVISSLPEKPDPEIVNEVKQAFDETEYTSSLEDKLEEMISLINGAGETRVIVTLECDYETVYAKDGSLSKNDSSMDEDSEYIIIDSEETQSGLLLKTVTPKIRGVAVVCAGGDSQYVQTAVIEMLSAVLDIGTNHISVAKIKY